MKQSRRGGAIIGLLVALCLTFGGVNALADDDTIAAGNGGTGDCAANGGALATGDVNAGENLGSMIEVGDSRGNVDASGGAMANTTALDASLNGGAGICDVSGADDNIVFKVHPTPTPAPVTPTPEPTQSPPATTSPPPGATEFRVCVDDGEVGVCLPGSCDESTQGVTCTIPNDCSLIPGNYTDPCQFDDCYIVETMATCNIPPPNPND